MKRQIGSAAMVMLFFPVVSSGTLEGPTRFWYETEQIDAERRQYEYKVSNIGLDVPIEQFTIWFDYGLYDNLAVETAEPLALEWDEIVVQPEPALSDNGYYDALALAGIAINPGETVSGFTVSFDWLGIGEPGSQLYEIIDPDTFETLDSGWTVPEPSTLLILGLGAVISRRKRRSDIVH